MQFTGTYHVSIDDYVHAARLARRGWESAYNIVGSLVILAILLQVWSSFALYVRTIVQSPQAMIELLRFNLGGAGAGSAAWLSVLVTLLLPVFLFYAIRTLIEALWPKRRIRRLLKGSDAFRPTNYHVDESGIRAQAVEGPDVFMPWTSFDTMRHDSDMAVLTRKKRMLFFVPLAAFGSERDAVLAHMASRVGDSAQSGSPRPAS
jgi:hypothetical protein